MGRKIKLIGLDLDGTLLNEKKEITGHTREILQRAIAKGIVVMVATGRPWTGVPAELQNFSGMHYALTSNGARVLEVKTGKILIQHLLAFDKAKKALEIAGKYDTLQEVYFNGQGYISKRQFENLPHYHNNPYVWEYIGTTRIVVPDVVKFFLERKDPVDKVQLLFANTKEKQKAWEELDAESGMVLTSSLENNIEINEMGVNKGKSLKELGMLLGIRPEEIMACGDGENDREMLKEVGFGVAMRNAQEDVKAVADYITDTNEEEGVAKAIEKFVL